MNEEVRELPLFPLNAVLFPGGPLPLRIFEPRYLDMISRCLREQAGFAVVLITEGEETAATASFAATGTEASIVDFDRLEGGLLGISCIGRERVRVLEAWREADGLNRGRVVAIDADPVLPVPAAQAWLGDVVRRVLPEAGDVYRHVEMRGRRGLGRQSPRRDAAAVTHRQAGFAGTDRSARAAYALEPASAVRSSALSGAVRQPRTGRARV